MFEFLHKIFGGSIGEGISRHPDYKYFMERTKTHPKAPLLTFDSNRQLQYDKRAVAGAKLYYDKNLWDINQKIDEIRSKRSSLPSAGNFFNKLSRRSGAIREAERQLDEAKEKLETYAVEVRKSREQLERLPELPVFVFDAAVKRKGTAAKPTRSERLHALRQKVSQVI